MSFYDKSAIVVNMANMIESPQGNIEYLSTRDAAERLGVAVRTVQLWVESGVLRAWKTAGGHRRIPHSEVDTLLASRLGQLSSATDSVPVPATPRGRFRVLVVEDDPALQLLMKMTLDATNLPIDIDLADNGFSALLKMGEQAPDLLITDLNMPGMDGFAMIRHLRASARWTTLPMVVVSALTSRDIEEHGGLPADIRRFDKPVPFDALEQLIRGEIERITPTTTDPKQA